MRNLGPKSRDWLKQVGIESRAQLCAVGVVPAYLMVRQTGVAVRLNLLWALEGAAHDVDWRTITTSRKQELLAELDHECQA